jgi:cytoskeletal protein RodZ
MARVRNNVSKKPRMPPRRTETETSREDDVKASGPVSSTGSSASGSAGGKRTPGRQPPWDKEKGGAGGGGPEGGSFGTWLRRQREVRQISLREVADRTKISLRYLEAMEEDRFDVLPAPVFAKGFLREYARYVGLSPDEVVNHYLAVQQPQPGEDLEETMIGKVVKAAKAERKARARSWGYAVFVVLAALAILGLVWLFSHLAQKRSQDPAASSPPPPIAAPPTDTVQAASLPAPAEAPKAPLEVTLDFTDDCWVQAVIDGKNHIEEQRVQGESMPILAQESVQLTLGNAGGVEIQVNGRPIDLKLKKGEVLRDYLITPETLRTLQEQDKKGAS